jgi:hypothetical protein
VSLVFPFENFAAVSFVGPMTAINVALVTVKPSVSAVANGGQQIMSPGHQSKVVNLVFDFLNQYPGQACTVNLNSQNTQGPLLDQLIMVYVDNSLNSSDVTVYFPDTQFVLDAPALTVGYYPVLPNLQTFTVYNGTTGQKPVTAQSVVSILACNFAVPGFLSQDTLNVTFNSSTGPKVPVLGDNTQTFLYNFSVGPINAPITVLPTIELPEQYVITGIWITLSTLYNDSNGTSQFLFLTLTDPSDNIVFREWVQFVTTKFPETPTQTISDETGLNFPLQGLTFTCAPVSGQSNTNLWLAEY